MPRGGYRPNAGRKPRTKDAKAAASSAASPEPQASAPPIDTARVLPLLEACTKKEQALILELVANPEITNREAFKRAGYKASSDEVADANAARVLSRDRVKRALAAMRREQLTRRAVAAVMDGDEAMARLSMYARVDIWPDVLGPEHPISKLPPEVRQCIKTIRPNKFGLVIERYDALHATESIAKGSGRLKEHVEVTERPPLFASSVEPSVDLNDAGT